MCLLTIIILLTVLGLVSSTPTSELRKRQSEGGSIMVVAPSENISPQAAKIASSLNGQFLYNQWLVTDSYPPPPPQDVSGLIIVGYWPGAFPGYQELLYTYDPVHQSLNRSDPSRNLIVIQSSQGEAVNDVFDPPDNEYWVVNNMELIGSGNGAQIALYGVQFPGWSACQRTNPATGLSYYQLYYQNFGTGCAAIQLVFSDIIETH